MPAIWKTQQWPQDRKKWVFIPTPKKAIAKESLNYCTIALISHTSKIMLIILQGSFQQYVNWEIPDVQTTFRKGRGIRDEIANIHWNIERSREFQKTSPSLNIHNPLIVWITTDCGKLWKSREYHHTCLLRNLYAGQKATVRNRHGTTDWFQIKKGVC